MRRINFVLLCLLLIVFSSRCGNPEPVSQVYKEADSILNLTLALQARIGSAEIQRMHEFQKEIDSDMLVLENMEHQDTSWLRYSKLSNNLRQCMQACNQYHEEAFMLESTLREIMLQSGEKNANMEKLIKMLDYETENYNDLFSRTDSNLNLALSQAEMFYNLKPEIDKIKEQVKTP